MVAVEAGASPADTRHRDTTHQLLKGRRNILVFHSLWTLQTVFRSADLNTAATPVDTFFFFQITPDCYNLTLDNIVTVYVLISKMLVNTWDYFSLENILCVFFYRVLYYRLKNKRF